MGLRARVRSARLGAVVGLLLSLAIVVTVAGPPAQAATTYVLTLKVSGLDQPVYMAAPPGETHRYFIIEKGGQIRIWETSGTLLATPFLDMSSLVSTDGERGLLSMAFDPDYGSNRRFYVYYADLSGNIVIARYTTLATNPNKADAASRLTLVSIPHPTYTNHYAGMLEFDPIAAEAGQSMLYFGTGDGGSSGDPNDNAQNTSSGLGKLFRIDVNAANPTKEMVAYGLRNPWRFSFDMLNGDLRIGDVGQDSWEELDFIKHGTTPGVNFGWRKYEGLALYHDEVIDTSRLTFPFQVYSHDGGNCAVVGGYMYRGSISSLYGYYLYADLCSGNIWRRQPGHAPIRMSISGQVSDIVSFAQGSLGGIYVISIDGSIWRLTTG